MKNTTQEQNTHQDRINLISNVLNSKSRNKNRVEILRNLLISFDGNLSKEFLKNLYEKGTNENKSTRLNYILNKVGYVTIPKNFYFNEMKFKKFKSVVTDWSQNHNNNKKQDVGVLFKQHNKKTFNFIVVNPIKIKLLQEQYKEMCLRNRALFEDIKINDGFNYVLNC